MAKNDFLLINLPHGNGHAYHRMHKFHLYQLQTVLCISFRHFL